MSEITLEHAKHMLRLWLNAEEAVSTGLSYKIGTRSLTRVDLAEIAKRITYWENRIAALENGSRGRRFYRAVPRDL